MDIWYSFQNNEGVFEKPINAGKKINTPEDEITPWFNVKDSVLCQVCYVYVYVLYKFAHLVFTP